MRLKLGEGDIEGAFQAAGEGNEDFDETLEGLDDKEAGKMLKEMNKLEAKIQKMQQSMEHRRNNGEDVDPEQVPLPLTHRALDHTLRVGTVLDGATER